MTKATFVFSNDLDLLDSAKELGFDTLFIGHQNLTPVWITKAKKLNFTVNVEVGVFAGENLWNKYPDARPLTKDGSPLPIVEWYAGVNPLSLSVWHEKFEDIRNVITGYNIDGIWLDFMRFPCHWEVENPELFDTDFSPTTLEIFKSDTGESMPVGETWWQWKCDIITNYVRQVRGLINELNPETKLGLFAVPWTPKDFDNAIHKIICQDFKSLSELVDVFSPMTYHAMCNREATWIGDACEYFSQFGKPLLPLIQTENKPREISPADFITSIEQAEKYSAGVTIFFLDDVIKQPEKVEVIRKIW
ncbi:hypothetical protein A3A70_01445 [candidate division WWE3 bacterium RIFCSPLOWO2_01_FULL_42_11]|uniref:Uncharacterized protein n=1 Tax=candidate division WWE3 bacterium RIFCSPLOWO2_01_FULL_42_11 TaxID=1802627 RepID=A0A1F4VMR1_UNCKA|nr:MAG: hypothetical protein A3A70_01445 [candidate division WWE3 bacterium RIFCSPLOWO2_01_FULL_42_11]